MLFAVAEAVAAGFHAHDDELRQLGGIYREAHLRGALGFDGEGQGGGVEHFLGCRLQNFYLCGAADSLLRSVHQPGGNLCLVVMADEARHIGLHHDRLRCHGLAVEPAVADFLVVGQAHEAPRGDALGQREVDDNAPFGIGAELWKEERRLVEVLPHLGCAALGALFFLTGNGNGFLFERDSTLVEFLNHIIVGCLIVHLSCMFSTASDHDSPLAAGRTAQCSPQRHQFLTWRTAQLIVVVVCYGAVFGVVDVLSLDRHTVT